MVISIDYIQFPYLKNMHIYLIAHALMITPREMRISKLGRRGPGGNSVLLYEYGCNFKTQLWWNWLCFYDNSLIWRRLYAMWTSGSVVEFSAPHSVVVPSISNGVDHGIYRWWDLIRSKQLFSVSVCRMQCLLDFRVMVILFIIDFSLISLVLIALFSCHGNSIYNDFLL